MMALSTCAYCGIEVDHRPYARVRDGIPSASAIAGLLDDGKSTSFGWAASLIAATTAVHHPDQWTGLIGVQSDRAVKNGHPDECTHDKDGLCKACTFLRSEFDRQWKTKANRGTHVHHLALSWALGEEVEVDGDCEPYMDALESFYLTHTPDWLQLERTILYDNPKSHAYRGQFDGIGTIDCPTCPPAGDTPARCKWLIDFKTGGYYPVEQTLQLSAYRYAKHLTTWEDKTEHLDGPPPAVAHAGVLLLGDDGVYRLGELPANGDAHGTFLRLRDAWGWSRQMERWAKEHPIAVTSNTVLEGVPA